MNNERTFEQAMIRLEEIARILERGDAPLDASIDLFGEGAALIKECGAKLDAAERKIELLARGQDGRPETRPFEQETLI